MVDRIDELEQWQLDLLPVVRDEWLAIGLSTEPADRLRAEAGVDLAYKAADLTPPDRKIWCDSPMAGAFKAAELVGTGDNPLTWEQARQQLSSAVFGNLDAGWLSFYDFFSRCGLDLSRLNGLTEVAKSAGWWWPFDDAVILTERPSVLKRDDEHRLHCEDGMALQYPDDWGVWAIHGVRVNEQIVMHPDTLTPSQILKENNAEVRRVMIDRYGIDKVMDGAKVLDTDLDAQGRPRELLRLELPDDEPIVAIRVINSSPEPDGHYKTYVLRCHPDLRPIRRGGIVGPEQALSCQNAIASLVGKTGAEYHPLIET
jgi:hypothetical protein